MAGEYESFLNLDVWTMIFAWCNILILFFFLKKLLFVPIKKMIDTRQQQIDSMYSSAREKETDAERMKTEYEEKLGEAKAQGEEILKDATARAQRQEAEILRQANADAQRTRERAEEQIAQERTQAMNQLKDEVSGMACDIASALIEKNLTKEDNDKLVDSFINGLGESK